MKQIVNMKTRHLWLILLFSLSALTCLFLYYYIGGYGKYDITGHWRICKYTLEGYNPYLLTGLDPVIESVGTIPHGFSTVPWGCVFGSIFYGGFLPLEWAVVYVYVLHFLTVAVLIGVLLKKFAHIFQSSTAIILFFIPLSHFSFMYSVHYGNAGAIICCLLIIALLIYEDNPWLAGILFGLSLMKPQISAIFCLVFLFKKQWKVLLVSFSIVFSGWGATALITKTNPLTLLLQTFDKGTASGGQYLGLFNNLKYFGIDSKIILMMNMVVGICFVTILYYHILNKSLQTNNSLFCFVPACIASTFWFYKNGTDYMILAFATLFFCILFLKANMVFKDCIGALFAIGYLQMSRCLVYLGIICFEDNLFVRDLFKSFDGLILGILGIYLCHSWKKYNGEAFLRIDNSNN
ncbi:MAG: DUF2029 domain-containing protein [Ruminococcaceae bacterium]|nr:DUF2029 domain-containing protein [Oscillospiraceae bacterium]